MFQRLQHGCLATAWRTSDARCQNNLLARPHEALPSGALGRSQRVPHKTAVGLEMLSGNMINALMQVGLLQCWCMLSQHPLASPVAGRTMNKAPFVVTRAMCRCFSTSDMIGIAVKFQSACLDLSRHQYARPQDLLTRQLIGMPSQKETKNRNPPSPTL